MRETEDIIHQSMDFFPLKEYKGITEGNALRKDWREVVPVDKLSFIMGNPPFVGYDMVTASQKQELWDLFGKRTTFLDYVGGWYIKAADLIDNTKIKCAFVSTNSITQGTQVGVLWPPILDRIKIDFAYRTFIWDSEASVKAHVHCVIIGFSHKSVVTKKTIFFDDSRSVVENITPYLTNGETVVVFQRSTPLYDVPKLVLGNMPKDGGGLIVKKEDLPQVDETGKKWIREYIGATEFINNKNVTVYG